MKEKAKQNVSSLFIGRWQPFHDGHRKLIESVLKNGKPVVIGIRDTEISHKNPYSTTERWSMIQRAFKEYGELVKIVVIPDIDEICYGRDVGYAIRRIDLDNQTESISGTKIRDEQKPNHSIIWLTGQSGAGKTTIARSLEVELGAVTLDGDEMRESISLGASFTKEDRDAHNLRVARLANVLARRTPVIVSVIAPFKETRDNITELIKPVWVYVKRELPTDKNKPYEVPEDPEITIDVDTMSVKDAVKSIVAFLKSR